MLVKPPSVPALLRLLGRDGGSAAPLQLDQSLQPLMEGFLASRQTELARLDAAIAQGQAAQVASIAHKLQGSFAMYGFGTASQIAIAIEQSANTDLGQSAVLLADLCQHLSRTSIQYV